MINKRQRVALALFLLACGVGELWISLTYADGSSGVRFAAALMGGGFIGCGIMTLIGLIP